MLPQISGQHELSDEVRVGPLSEDRVANHFETVLDPGGFVDIDVRGQVTRLSVPHKGHLKIGVRITRLKAAFSKLEPGQRFMNVSGADL